MTLTVSCSRQIAIRKSSILDLKTVGNNKKRGLANFSSNGNKNKNKNKQQNNGNSRGLVVKNNKAPILNRKPVFQVRVNQNRKTNKNVKNHNNKKLNQRNKKPNNPAKNKGNQRSCRGSDNGKPCYVSPYYVPKNPTMNTNTCGNNYLKNCRASLTIPWKPMALRHLRSHPHS